MRFRAKPVEVEGILWTGKNTGVVNKWLHERATDPTIALFLVKKSVSRNIWANVAGDDWPDDVEAVVYDQMHDAYDPLKVGQWIFQGLGGEFYPIDEQIVKLKYDIVEGSHDRAADVEAPDGLVEHARP